MTKPEEPLGTEATRGRRSLERPPGERFRRGRGAALDDLEASRSGSLVRAIGFGLIGAVVGLLVFLVLAAAFSFTAGLVVVAIFMARLIGLFVRAGAAGTLSSPARVVVAVVLFLVGMTAANVVTWLWALAEGGDLGLIDYLSQVYGTPLVALEFMIGTLTAWWSAR